MTQDSSKSPAPALAVSSEQMRLVLEVSRSLAITTDLDNLLMRIARAATAMLACERASVFLHDPRTNELWTKVALQSDPIRVPAGTGIVGKAFTSNEVIHCANAYGDPDFNSDPDRLSGFVTRNLLAAPMLDWSGRPVGVLQALNKIAGHFTDIDSALLRLLADQAGVAIQRWTLQQQAIQSSSLEHEMQLARQIQEAVIPRHPPQIPGLRCAGWTRPASINGGDCFDLWRCGEQLGVLVADASGHGMGPALVVSQVRAMIRVLSELEQDPLKVLLRINDRLAEDLDRGRFVTAFLGFISPDGLLTWAAAGHGSTLVHKMDGRFQLLDPTWPPLSYMQDAAGGTTHSVQLSPGDSLIVVSDGITEAFDAREDLFDLARVCEALATQPSADPDAAVSAVRAAVIQWQGKEEPADDQTMVVVERP